MPDFLFSNFKAEPFSRQTDIFGDFETFQYLCLFLGLSKVKN